MFVLADCCRDGRPRRIATSARVHKCRARSDCPELRLAGFHVSTTAGSGVCCCPELVMTHPSEFTSAEPWSGPI